MRVSSVRFEDRILHTGQHYDDAMSKIFFEELDIPAPAVNLGVGSGPQGRQTARMLEAIEAYLSESRPDAVIVYGDTNSTLAGALAAAKMLIPVVHIEAGLRSFNRAMPEELNRIATDHLSDLLFAPTATAVDNLGKEGLRSRTRLTGDVMYDAVLFYAQIARQRSPILEHLQVTAGEYGVVTIHRAENTVPGELLKLLASINEAAVRVRRLIFPIHPRTRSVLRTVLGEWRPAANLVIVDPLGYLDMLALVQSACCVLTDSGGLQKEAFFLNTPCITLRNETEWLETLESGANSLASADGTHLAEKLEEAIRLPRNPFAGPPVGRDGPFGDGRAAERVVSAIATFCGVTR
jgi:UDP-N-acetylglucosamine 2-epimerase